VENKQILYKVQGFGVSRKALLSQKQGSSFNVSEILIMLKLLPKVMVQISISPLTYTQNFHICSLNPLPGMG
jgi:hypothetical protein